MGKQHLDLLPELHRDVVLPGIGNVAGNLTGIFMFLPVDLACIGVRATLGFGRAGLADLLSVPDNGRCLCRSALGSGRSSCVGTV